MFSLKKINEYDKQEMELKVLKYNLLNIENLLSLLRTQRHDYINHIQTVQSMIYLEEYKEAMEYLNGISKNYRWTSEVIRVGHPALTALLNTKKEIAERNGIEFHIQCKTQLKINYTKSWDLCNLIGNVVDNAIEATVYNDNKRWIKVKVYNSSDKYTFEIENTGQLNKTNIERLFNEGYTTKEGIGRGYGLYIAKKIVDKYGGEITLKESEHNTVICTVLLPKGDSDYDRKTV